MDQVDIFRAAFSFFGGALLTLSGSLAQLTTHNDLASPSTLGFDGIIVLMLLISHFILLSLGIANGLGPLSFILSVSIVLMAVALKGVFLKQQISSMQKKMKIFILMGLGLNLLIGAVFSFVQFVFMTLNIRFPTSLWFGSFRYYDQWWLFLFIFGALMSFLFLRKNLGRLTLLSIGHDFARGYERNLSGVQTQSLLLSYFLTALVVCFFGVFSFFSLITPHLFRQIFKASLRKELLYGPLLGGVTMLSVDQLCYWVVFYGVEFPAGMVSSILGPLFLLTMLSKFVKVRN